MTKNSDIYGTIVEKENNNDLKKYQYNILNQMNPKTKSELRIEIEHLKFKITGLEESLEQEKKKSMRLFNVAAEISKMHMQDIQDHFAREDSELDSDSDSDSD
jgi:hypothetical protein